ncbi:MAG: hypothetical protein ACXVDJ_05300, partial [Tumebacillaceae bacterium]
RPGSSNMESGAISEKQLATNIVFQGDKGQLYLYLNDGNGQFEEFDRQLKPLRKLSWEDVQHESRQLSVQERNQIQVGNNTYSILTMSNPKGTQIAVVDGRSGDVVRTITADFDANVSYANGMFYAVGKVEPKMAVLTQYGKLENEITTTGMDSNVVMK